MPERRPDPEVPALPGLSTLAALSPWLGLDDLAEVFARCRFLPWPHVVPPRAPGHVMPGHRLSHPPEEPTDG